MALTATIAGVASAGVSVASGVSNLIGGNDSTPTGAPGNYVPQNPGAADASLQQLMSAFTPYATGLPGSVIPGITANANQLANNPFAPAAQQGANASGAAGTGFLAPNAFQGASALQGLGNYGAAFAPAALNAGFDPQNAMYGRLFQQNQDQSNAINAQNGVAGTPYGAGLATQSNQNFNTDWLYNLLQRQGQGASTYGSLLNTSGQGYSGAANLGAVGADALNQYGAAPYNMFNTIGSNNLSALNQISSGTANAFLPGQTVAGISGGYLGDTQQAVNTGLQAQGQAFNQGQTNGSNLGSSLAALGNLFKPSTNVGASASAAYPQGVAQGIF